MPTNVAWCNWVDLFRSVQFSSCALNDALRAVPYAAMNSPVWILIDAMSVTNGNHHHQQQHHWARSQVCAERTSSALNMTLLAFAAERRRLHHGACSVPAASDRYLLLAGHRTLSSKPACCRYWCGSMGETNGWIDGQTDGRTDARYIDPVTQTTRAVSKGGINWWRLSPPTMAEVWEVVSIIPFKRH